MSHFTTPPESQEQRKNNPTHIPNHIGRAEQDVCTPTCWHTLFSKRLLKTRFIPLELDFLQYLLQDGLILPRGTHIHGVSGDQLSDDENMAEHCPPHTNPDLDPDNEVPSFSALTAAIDSAIAELGGRVFVKINWMSALDAAWVNGGVPVCHTAGDVYLLLKSSDKIASVVETLLHQLETEVVSEKLAEASRVPTLCLVKWANLFPSMEFRCFVKNKRLAGICQRNCSTHFEFLEADISWIRDTVAGVFHSSVKNSFPLPSYVFDIYIDKQRRLWLLDFNTFGDPTKPLLFDWSDFDTPVVEELDLEDVEQEHEELELEVLLRTVLTSADLLPHEAGQSRGPTDVIDHQAQLSSMMKLSQVELAALQGATSSSDDDDDDDGKEEQARNQDQQDMS